MPSHLISNCGFASVLSKHLWNSRTYSLPSHLGYLTTYTQKTAHLTNLPTHKNSAHLTNLPTHKDGTPHKPTYTQKTMHTSQTYLHTKDGTPHRPTYTQRRHTSQTYLHTKDGTPHRLTYTQKMAHLTNLPSSQTVSLATSTSATSLATHNFGLTPDL